MSFIVAYYIHYDQNYYCILEYNKYLQGSSQDLETAPTTRGKQNKESTEIVKHKNEDACFNFMVLQNGPTSPIRFSRQSMTELLVAAEQTANFFPYNNSK